MARKSTGSPAVRVVLNNGSSGGGVAPKANVALPDVVVVPKKADEASPAPPVAVEEKKVEEPPSSKEAVEPPPAIPDPSPPPPPPAVPPVPAAPQLPPAPVRVILPDSLFPGLDTPDGVFVGEVLIVKNERNNCGLQPLGEASVIADFGGLVCEEGQLEAAEATKAALAAGLVNCALIPVMARMHVVRVYYLRAGSLTSLPPDKLATAKLLLQAFRRNAREH
jgi:hypothetical protein